tara:strand:- start:72 stop:860 length:789 start_codon:yes stop_codon:yes gene_type:complete
MHKFTIQLSDKSGYNYDLVNDKNGKIIHSWKRPKMLAKWIGGYVPGNGWNFVSYVDKNGSGKFKVKPNKFIIPFRESKSPIKMTQLLTEFVTDSEFNKALKQAKKDTGAPLKVPSKTIKLCKEVGKLKINKYDYKGKKSKSRKVDSLMYQYYAYVQGWGHTKFKGPGTWTFYEDDKILQHIYKKGRHALFDYSYLKWHVTSDIQAAQIVANLSPGEKDVEPGYYLAKDYYNSFGASRSRNVVFDYCVTKVEAWMRDNKIETL